ncbi:MAG TPA: tRNA pseudouridine(13) synthase TruD [Polyangiaceae bacterium]|nr:tRNA pseudouridine(13) synthase TruD [Polyangiaceae bacterium]
MTEKLAPAIPPIATNDLPATGGAIGPEPEDFQVDELPLYAFSGEGEHLYVRVKKRLMTTREAVGALARAAGVPQSEIGTAGMKDKHAVTTQWMSLPARRAKPLEAWALADGLSILESTRHGNKLRTGHLKGNLFRIRLVDVVENAESNAVAIAARLRERGLPNYFGAQRFGRDGANLASAVDWLEAEARGDRGRVPPFERKLYASVVQAEVYNRYVTARMERGLERPLIGEVVRLEGTGSMFAVEDQEKELPRWMSKDIHPTGPMIGPKMRKALGEALALEEASIASVGLTGDALTALGRHADGTRRDVLLHIPTLRVSAASTQDGTGAASTGNAAGGRTLTLELELPSGSYATEVVREFSREAFFRYSG